MALGVAAVAAPSNRGRASNRGEGGVDGGSIDDEEPGGCSSVFNDGGGPVVARADFFFEDDVPSDRPFPCLLAAPTGEEIPSSLLRAGAPSDFLLACVFDFAFDFAFNFTSPPPPKLPPLPSPPPPSLPPPPPPLSSEDEQSKFTATTFPLPFSSGLTFAPTLPLPPPRSSSSADDSVFERWEPLRGCFFAGAGSVDAGCCLRPSPPLAERASLALDPGLTLFLLLLFLLFL